MKTPQAQPALAASAGSATDPDLGEIRPGHVCKHGVRWPHPCVPCDDAAWELHLRQSPNSGMSDSQSQYPVGSAPPKTEESQSAS